MELKVTCIVQARTNSSRLPGKLLLQLGRKTVFQYFIERLKLSKKIDSLVIATTKNKLDNEICKISKSNKITVFRGSERNVLNRFYNCAKKNKSSVIIRVTADCPLIDIKYVDTLIEVFKKNNYDYLNNTDINYLPDGFHCEIFSFDALEKSYKRAKSKFDKQHVTSYIWKNPDKFKIKVYRGRKIKNFTKKLRLTLDYYQDFKLIRKIFINLYKKNKYFSLEEILNFLKKNQDLMKINEKYLMLQWNKYHSRRLKYISINKKFKDNLKEL